MRTILLIAVGIGLAVVVAVAARRRAPEHRTTAAGGFTAAWLAVTVANLLLGLSHGYSLAEELPIQATIFVLPVGTAWLLARRRPVA